MRTYYLMLIPEEQPNKLLEKKNGETKFNAEELREAVNFVNTQLPNNVRGVVLTHICEDKRKSSNSMDLDEPPNAT